MPVCFHPFKIKWTNTQGGFCATLTHNSSYFFVHFFITFLLLGVSCCQLYLFRRQGRPQGKSVWHQFLWWYSSLGSICPGIFYVSLFYFSSFKIKMKVTGMALSVRTDVCLLMNFQYFGEYLQWLSGDCGTFKSYCAFKKCLLCLLFINLSLLRFFY